MRSLLASFVLLLCTVCTRAQNAVTISGTVKNTTTGEGVIAASIVIKGGSATGTFTDDKGYFKFTVKHSLPLTLIVSSIGFANKEVTVETSGESIAVTLTPTVSLGQEVVVSASRTPERILESPVTIERVGAAAITAAPASSYYDIIGNLKGVDLVSSGLLYKTPSTRGFNISGNTRLNQLVDGMDNQAPGLNFAVGAIVGPTELDVESIELLGGASSALYGPGGMNGTLLINSKSPFKYPGLSVQVKGGVNHINDYARAASPYFDATLRWGYKISDKFAFKLSGEIIQAKDWVARDTTDYGRITTSLGYVKAGQTRASDPGYDGINVYGDETTTNFSNILQAYASVPGLGPILQPFINNPKYDSVSRTGYREQDVIDPTTYNLKASAGLYYMVTPSTELSFLVNHGNGNTVYTGSDRYSLKNFSIDQYKLEAKSRNWLVRAYTTQEDAGKSYNATVTMRLLNEGWAPSATVWYPRFTGAFITGASNVWTQAYGIASMSGQTQEQAAATASAATLANGDALFAAARAYADSARPAPGSAAFNSIYNSLIQKPISENGGKFVDHTALYVGEGQWNLTELLKLKRDDNRTDILVGGDYKRYVLNSKGTLFADTAGTIPINEYGLYLQASQKFFNVLRLTASGRYDKNENFKGRFTPRISAVVTVAKNQNIRLSYQTAYRFPTTQQQWINLTVGAGKLIGGLPDLRKFYHFDTNPVYTQASFGAFIGAGGDTTKLQVQQFGEYKPESCESYEIGYKGLISNKFLIDAYVYTSSYKNFIGRINVVQSSNGQITGLFAPIGYSVSVNSTSRVKTDGWGLSLQYLLPNNFNIGGNLYSDEIRDVSANFISGFNAPKYRTNISFGNSGIFLKKHLGFNLMYKWQDKVHYESDFAIGDTKAFSTLDGQISYNLSKNKAIFKIGGTNLFNHYYVNGFGNPSIGALYYLSVTVNVL